VSCLQPCIEPCVCWSAGLWATLQFKWIQLQYPAVTLAFEKMLMAACLPVAVAMHTWGAVATVGAEAAAYYLAALLGILYYSFAVPLPSSFFRKPASRGIGALPLPRLWAAMTR